jgi:molybdopterin synthase sulfur carrier subunit
VIEVHYFASVREGLGLAHERVAAGSGAQTVASLLDRLVAMHGSRGEHTLRGGRVLMAVNQQVARADTPVHDGDEVAFFPPVTGG